MSTNTLDTTNPATCRALPTGIANLSTKIENCTRPEEKTRKNVGDSLSVGESMFGSYGHSDITKQIRDRNHDLKKKKEDLIQDINKKESIIERANRDFTDVKRTLPEKQPKKILHFIEDYTMALLAISYLFMLCIGIYYFSTITSGEFNTSDFFKALMNGAILSIVVGVVIYYIS
jgi:hypothetical protein